MKIVGIVGGMGPLVSNYLASLIMERNPVISEREHIETIVYNAVSIPDRTAYLLGESEENPHFKILEIMKKLEGIGAEIIAIPCITAHYFRKDLKRECGVMFIDLVEELIQKFLEEGLTEAGLLATRGTIMTHFFEEAFKERGLRILTPKEDSQKKLMSIIYNEIKLGKSVREEDFTYCVEDLKNQGCEKIILGCTELSFLSKNFELGEDFIDPLKLLADLCIKYAKEA